MRRRTSPPGPLPSGAAPTGDPEANEALIDRSQELGSLARSRRALLARLFSLEARPSRRPRLDDLPEPAFLRLAQLLPAPDVAVLARTSRALQSACRDESLWGALFRRDFLPAEVSAVAVETAASAATAPSLVRRVSEHLGLTPRPAEVAPFRAQYCARYAERRAQEKRVRALAGQAATREVESVRQARRRLCLDRFLVYGVGTLNLVLMGLFWGLLGARLDGWLGEASYFLVFAPLELVVIVSLVYWGLYVRAGVADALYGSEHVSEWTGHMDRCFMIPCHVLHRWGAVEGRVLSTFFTGHRWVVFVATTLAMLVHPVLALAMPLAIAAKLEWPESASWAAWLTPVWASLGWAVVVVGPLWRAAGEPNRVAKNVTAYAFLSVIVPLSTLIPVVVRADSGLDFNLFYAFIPVFLVLFVFGFAFVAIFVASSSPYIGTGPMWQFFRCVALQSLLVCVCGTLTVTFTCLLVSDSSKLPEGFGALQALLPLVVLSLGSIASVFYIQWMFIADAEREAERERAREGLPIGRFG